MKLVVDQINKKTARLIKENDVREVTSLDAETGFGIKKSRIGLRKTRIHRPLFFAGSLIGGTGCPVYFQARKDAGTLSLKIARRLLSESALDGYQINESYKDNIILYIAKTIQFPVGDVLMRIYAAQALCGDNASGDEKLSVCVCASHLFREEDFSEYAPNTQLKFYRNSASSVLSILKRVFFEWGRRFILSTRRSRIEEYSLDSKNKILLVQSDDVVLDRSVRSQPYWLDESCSGSVGDVIIITAGKKNQLASRLIVDKNVRRLGIKLLDPSYGVRHLRPVSKHPAIQSIRRAKSVAFHAIVSSWSLRQRTLHSLVWGFLTRAEELCTTCITAKVTVSLIEEPYRIETDAICLFSKELNIRTLSLQYSNLPWVSPLMLANVDEMLTFSNEYRAIFCADGIGARQFQSVGYLYDSAGARVRARAAEGRRALEVAGARFIICYFDESVQADCWGAISRDEHLSDFLALARWVLNKGDRGLVIKSQFARNSPKTIFAGHPVFKELIASGRYVELGSGIGHRNTVFPVEGSLIADLSIGHLVGATAALEAAVAGKRAVLLNPKGIVTDHDLIYRKANIMYSRLSDLLMDLDIKLQAGSFDKSDLGDWSKIIRYFDPFRDGRSASRIQHAVRSPIS
jgi:hypothetical protein